MTTIEKHYAILIVDDEEINVDILLHTLSDKYDVSVAMDGYSALELARENPFDMVLLDIMMPGLDGFQVCEQLKANPATRKIPVVFITARTAREDLVKGLSLGALHYITKPFDLDVLLTICESVLTDYSTYRALQEELHNSRDSMSLLEEGRFRFRTLDEAEKLSLILARICPIPEECCLGLRELMINAVEHGNLNITYADKTKLNSEGRWRNEILQRLEQPKFKHLYATIQVTRNDNHVHFLIRDQGKGFDWRPFLEFSLERVFDSHGRGIAISQSSGFSKVSFQGIGNEVVAEAPIQEKI